MKKTKKKKEEKEKEKESHVDEEVYVCWFTMFKNTLHTIGVFSLFFVEFCDVPTLAIDHPHDGN